jgi:hypothetical protein
MVRTEVEISVSVRGFPVDFDGQCRLFLGDQKSRKGITLSDATSAVNWMEDLKLLRWLQKFCSHSGPRGQITNV